MIASKIYFLDSVFDNDVVNCYVLFQNPITLKDVKYSLQNNFNKLLLPGIIEEHTHDILFILLNISVFAAFSASLQLKTFSWWKIVPKFYNPGVMSACMRFSLEGLPKKTQKVKY